MKTVSYSVHAATYGVKSLARGRCDYKRSFRLKRHAISCLHLAISMQEKQDWSGFFHLFAIGAIYRGESFKITGWKKTITQTSRLPMPEYRTKGSQVVKGSKR